MYGIRMTKGEIIHISGIELEAHQHVLGTTALVGNKKWGLRCHTVYPSRSSLSSLAKTITTTQEHQHIHHFMKSEHQL